MNLTREQAISEHRKMWNWIADKIETIKHTIHIITYKKKYLEINGFVDIIDSCFMCEYVVSIQKGCEQCPIDSWTDSIYCLGGLFEKCCNAESWQEQAALARQIANLPERKDV